VSLLTSCHQFLSSFIDLEIFKFLNHSLYRLPVYVIICILCLIIALFSKLQKHPPEYINTFIAYISITILVEIIGWFYSVHRANNLVFYNFYLVMNFPYLIYLIRSFLVNKKVKKMLAWIAILYPIFATMNILLVQGLHNFNTYIFISGCILVVMACIFYFYERIKYPGPDSLLHDSTFWIATSLLFYYTCSLPLNGILNVISNMPFYVYKTIYLINVVINSVLYLLFSISFICNRIFRRSS
jgi:hypothetical protein